MRRSNTVLSVQLCITSEATSATNKTCPIYNQCCQQRSRVSCCVDTLTDLVAVAGYTGRVLPLVEVVPTALAVGAVPVPGAVQAVAAVPCLLVQRLVEVAPVTEAVAVTR